MSRLAIAMVLFLVLGVLTWTTIGDPKLRLATLAILGLFALKTVVRRKDVMHPDDERDVGTGKNVEGPS